MRDNINLPLHTTAFQQESDRAYHRFQSINKGEHFVDNEIAAVLGTLPDFLSNYGEKETSGLREGCLYHCIWDLLY